MLLELDVVANEGAVKDIFPDAERDVSDEDVMCVDPPDCRRKSLPDLRLPLPCVESL